MLLSGRGIPQRAGALSASRKRRDTQGESLPLEQGGAIKMTGRRGNSLPLQRPKIFPPLLLQSRSLRCSSSSHPRLWAGVTATPPGTGSWATLGLPPTAASSSWGSCSDSLTFRKMTYTSPGSLMQVRSMREQQAPCLLCIIRPSIHPVLHPPYPVCRALRSEPGQGDRSSKRV